MACGVRGDEDGLKVSKTGAGRGWGEGGGGGGEGRGCRTEGLARDEIVERAAGTGTRNVDFVLSLSSLTASPRRRYSKGV